MKHKHGHCIIVPRFYWPYLILLLFMIHPPISTHHVSSFLHSSFLLASRICLPFSRPSFPADTGPFFPFQHAPTRTIIFALFFLTILPHPFLSRICRFLPRIHSHRQVPCLVHVCPRLALVCPCSRSNGSTLMVLALVYFPTQPWVWVNRLRLIQLLYLVVLS